MYVPNGRLSYDELEKKCYVALFFLLFLLLYKKNKSSEIVNVHKIVSYQAIHSTVNVPASHKINYGSQLFSSPFVCKQNEQVGNLHSVFKTKLIIFSLLFSCLKLDNRNIDLYNRK